MNYPDWRTVRRSYHRRRQNKQEIISDSLYDLPEHLMVNQIGAIKLELGKQITQNEM